MSSQYHLLCIAHDPAIVIDIDATRPETALAAITDRASHPALNEHPHCPLMIGRYSYPLVELCCPGSQDDRHPTSDEWMDVSLLRVVALAWMQPSDTEMSEALGRLHRCWEPKRLSRLRYELGIERHREDGHPRDTCPQCGCDRCGPTVYETLRSGRLAAGTEVS